MLFWGQDEFWKTSSNSNESLADIQAGCKLTRITINVEVCLAQFYAVRIVSNFDLDEFVCLSCVAGGIDTELILC